MIVAQNLLTTRADSLQAFDEVIYDGKAHTVLWEIQGGATGLCCYMLCPTGKRIDKFAVSWYRGTLVQVVGPIDEVIL